MESVKIARISFDNAVKKEDKTIQDNNESLRLLEKTKIEIMNEVARARHKIEQLKETLAKKNHLLRTSREFEDTLLLQAEKLRIEKDKLNQRCENVIQEMKDRLRVKDKVIAQVRLEIDNYLRLEEEVKQRNEVLKGKLEKREKIATALKTKVQMLSTWNVRSSSTTELY